MNRSLYSPSGRLALVIAIMISAATAFASGPYDNALINLRSAHYLIDSHPADWKGAPQETEAKNDIAAAMGEIKKAGIDDGKDLKEHPLDVERITDRKSRLLKALQLLKTTQTEITRAEESDPKKKQLKASSLAHLSQAIKNVDKLIAALK
jgi:hypothetical protein